MLSVMFPFEEMYSVHSLSLDCAVEGTLAAGSFSVPLWKEV